MIFINLDNLIVGHKYKNYKELCNALCVSVLSGNSKISQLAWFSLHFTHVREGHGFIVTSIFNRDIQPMPIRGAREVEYVKNIELLILDILAQDNYDGKVFFPKNKLFRMLEMVNDNYIDCNRRVPKLSKFLDIDENSVQEWYDTTGGMLERNLDSALKKLANQSLIFWSREITICQAVEIVGSDYMVKSEHTNIYGEKVEKWEKLRLTRKEYREATDDEKTYILKIERETMIKLECNNKQEVIRRSLWNTFTRTVGDIIRKEKDILFYYQSYKILFNPDHILNKQIQVNELLLDKDKRSEQKAIVNTSIMKRVENNAESRKENAIKTIDINDTSNPSNIKLLRRTDVEYVNDNIKLNETLIDQKSKGIKSQVRKVKLD